MPIEVRELVIKAQVGGEAKSQDAAPAPDAKSGKKGDMDINEIVALVFDRIREKLER